MVERTLYVPEIDGERLLDEVGDDDLELLRIAAALVRFLAERPKDEERT